MSSHFDANAPNKKLYGRKLVNGFARSATLSSCLRWYRNKAHWFSIRPETMEKSEHFKTQTHLLDIINQSDWFRIFIHVAPSKYPWWTVDETGVPCFFTHLLICQGSFSLASPPELITYWRRLCNINIRRWRWVRPQHVFYVWQPANFA